MKTVGAVVLGVALLLGSYLAGRWQSATPLSTTHEKKILYYICPMHPQYKSDRPGNAPCCGMRLEPVYADGSGASRKSPRPGAIQVSPERQQLIGVRFAAAAHTPGAETIRAFGKVTSIQEGTVVVLADLFEADALRVSVGQSALVTQPFPPKKSFGGKIDFIFPRMDGNSRTLKIRVNARAPGFPIISESYWNVDIRIDGPPALAVPSTAVLDSGVRKRVFVDLGEGYLEPREVETGRLLGDRREITRGLRPGERVAVSGAFLLDSEAQLQAVASSVAAPAAKPDTHLDPVCGMSVTEKKAAGKSEYRGRTYYFCSTHCKEKFDRTPGAYMVPAAAAQSAPAAPRAHPDSVSAPDNSSPPPAGVAGAQPSGNLHIDPVCGMPVKETTLRRRSAEYHEHRFYFCSVECWREFTMDSETYGAKALAALEKAAAATRDTPEGNSRRHD